MIAGSPIARCYARYALAEHLEQSIGWTLGLKRSAIYAMLTRFENRGLVTRESMKDTRYPERHTYRVTPEGEVALQALRDDAVDDNSAPNLPLAVLLMFIDDMPEPGRADNLSRLRDWRVERLAEFSDTGEHDGTVAVALGLIASQLQLEIDCLDRLIADGAQ